LVKKTSYSKFEPTVEIHIRFKLKKGQKVTEYKTDSQNNLHYVLGKLSDQPAQLEEKFRQLLAAVNKYHPVSVTICSTMGPGIKVEPEGN